jgi:AraC-like DNA-binding protein
VVLQFKEDFMGRDFKDISEFQKIGDLIDLSLHGMSFYGKTKTKVGQLLDEMVVMNHFDRLLHTLRILQIMANSDEYRILNASKVTIEINQQDKDRIKLIYDFVRENFQKEISLEEMSILTNMTVPSFCRYFKKQSGKTFTQFVNEFKVIHACKLLSETGRTVADICFECGFNNFSHFNKHFKIVTGKSPSDYRSEFRLVIS